MTREHRAVAQLDVNVSKGMGEFVVHTPDAPSEPKPEKPKAKRRRKKTG